MEIQTWVSLVTIVAAMAGLYAALRRDFRTELKGEIGGLRTELKGEIGGLRTELKVDIARLDDRVGELKDRVGNLEDRVAKLDDRVYALAAGLQPILEERRHESG